MATIASRRGSAGEDAVQALTEFCRRMCGRKTRPAIPIYGANDWCYSYGQSSAETILRDTEFIVEVSPDGPSRPFSVIDGGWADGAVGWPDMGKLAADIKRRDARPGLWVRPLEAPETTAVHLTLSEGRFGERKERGRERAYDPTVSEARDAIRAKLRQASGWGYEMVKHDFSTYDLLGQWGFEMGPQPTLPGWSFSDRSRTNAEIIADLYLLLRETVGDQILLDGCNTIGHLGQGVFDLQRIGDDTSGHQWERTRRMGVNALSFRLPQQGTFFAIDADLVGMTDDVPWAENRQWLDVLARSGTATLVSVAPSQRGPEQRAALRDAFKMAAAGGAGAKPIDWMETSAPGHWRGTGNRGASERHYDWAGRDGAFPFLSP
jgi:alpha-galactosidase